MKHGRRPAQFVFFAFLVLYVISLAWGQEKSEWSCKDRTGQIKTVTDLHNVLQKHKQWLETNGELGTRANLSGAVLTGENLSGAVLIKADLRAAALTDADLSVADLNKADLSCADLINASLSSASLSGASLSDADLTGAALINADLTGVDLSGADLTDVDFKGAWLVSANLHSATFQVKSNPEIAGIAGAKNLEFMTYWDNPGALVQLRNEFKDGGFRQQERKITYVLQRREAELYWEDCALWPINDLLKCGNYWFNRIFFELTCQYGMNPGRPLLLTVQIWFICSFVYALFIHLPGPSGLYIIEKQGLGEKGNIETIQIRPRSIKPKNNWKYPIYVLWREWHVLRTAMFFSLMSAFNIGFRDIDFGRWLRLLTTTEYDIKAVGWARTVSGFQALISLYMIALWVLTYFGRPFE